MFKRRGQRNETKKQKSKQLWGRDFNIVENGLDEAQVVSFVNDLMKRYEASSPASVLKTAVADAEQILTSIKMRAQAEAEEAAARIVAQANQEAEKIKGSSATVAEREAEDILSLANREAELAEAEAKPEALPETGEKAEETIEEKAGGTIEEQEEVSKLAEKEPLETPSPEEGRETESDLVRRESHSLYTGEVELAIANPVAPKMVAKLYGYLQTTPEIKFVRTSGSWDRGTTITIVLDKPIPLVDVLSAKIPEAKVMAERPERDGFVKGRRGVRRISLALKEV